MKKKLKSWQKLLVLIGLLAVAFVTGGFGINAIDTGNWTVFVITIVALFVFVYYMAEMFND